MSSFIQYLINQYNDMNLLKRYGLLLNEFYGECSKFTVGWEWVGECCDRIQCILIQKPSHRNFSCIII